MLVLSRKQGEAIHIGNDVVIVVSEIRGSRARIAIDAPRTTKIRRGELRPDGFDAEGDLFVYRENGKVIQSDESLSVMEEWMDAKDAASRRSR